MLEQAVEAERGVRCEHGDRCGGCALLGMPEPEQLRFKHAAVQAALARYPGLALLPVAGVVPARPAVGYRTRAKLMVARDGAIGLYARASHDVVDIPGCRVLAPELMRTVAAIRTLLKRRTHAGLDGIDVRATRTDGGSRLLVTLNGDARAAARLEELARELLECEGVAGVALSERDASSPTFFGAAPRLVAGEGALRDQLSPRGPYHLASHGSFAQAHRAQAAAIAARVLTGLSHTLGTLRGARVLELYAGSGALGLELQQRGARAFLVERFPQALELAERAAGEQAITGLLTRTGDAARVVSELARAGERFDAVIVNPPRSGLPSEVRSGVAALGARALVYVSCDPQTLARDLSALELLGYAARTLEPYDLMPLTDAVETLAWLAPAPPLPIAILYEDAELLAVAKPPHLNTTPQGDRSQSLLELVRAQQELKELAPVHRLDAGTSGVCLLAKKKSAVARLAASLRDGQKHYLALARGITRDKGSVRRPLREGAALREARTRYTRLEVIAGHSFLRVRPDEGRTHQIRRHLAAIGHPVLGDFRHGDAASNRHLEQKYGLDRTFLHLAKLELPSSGRAAPLVLEAPLPGDLQAVREQMRDASK